MTAIQSSLPSAIEISIKQKTNHASQDLIHLGILTGNINPSQCSIQQCRSRKKIGFKKILKKNYFSLAHYWTQYSLKSTKIVLQSFKKNHVINSAALFLWKMGYFFMIFITANCFKVKAEVLVCNINTIMFLFAFMHHHLQVFCIDLQSTQSVLKCLQLKLWEVCFMGRKCKHLKQTIYFSSSITNTI